MSDRAPGRAHRRRRVVRTARALGGEALVVGTAATVGAGALAPDRPVEVIGRVGVEAVLWPLVPVLLAVVVPASTAWRARALERVARRGHATLAGRHLGLVLASGLVVVASVPVDQRVLVARNVLGLVGLALVGVRVLSVELAWVPLVGLAATTWLFGTRLGGVPRPWALLLAEPGHRWAWAVAVVAASSGVASSLVPDLAVRPRRRSAGAGRPAASG